MQMHFHRKLPIPMEVKKRISINRTHDKGERRARCRNQNADIKRLVKGLMIESYIEDGAQGVGEHTFGKSITDPCLGWEKTEKLIYDLVEKL